MSPFILEATLHWTSVVLYILATVIFAHALLWNHPTRARWAVFLAALGLAPHAGAILARWIAVGHGPYMAKSEVLSSNAWIAVVMLLVVLWRRPSWAGLALVALPGAILMMGLGLLASPEAKELPPTLRSIWLVFHIFFTKLAVGAFLLAFAAAVLVLRKLKGATSPFLARFPSAEVLDASMIRFVGFGFVFWSTTIIAGAIWAHQSWGRYWGWDPIETWSLVTWLCFGTLLHLRLFYRLGPRATAWFTIGCFGVSILTAFIFPFLLPSLHAAYFQ
ncbi:cytochrome c biogenesis protein [Geothrix alkalitolerans]|uniref:cytochrome c biogenesis protein n=1 Tax=Geothrix alkalitolerans TaxID=2922724 RepID=UPI001FB01225|nr:cytochrome c biogenesis protein CcsA [Geothrix alkalitolerans]